MTDPVLDGTGGGFGKHPGLPVREVLAIFDRAAAEPKMRSVRTILRVGREQVEARGSLEVGGKIAAACFVLAVLAGAVWLLKVPTLADSAPAAGGVAVAIGAAMTVGAYSTRHDRKVNLAQIRLLRDGARDALVKIATHPDFVREELDWSERNALEKLVGKGKVDL